MNKISYKGKALLASALLLGATSLNAGCFATQRPDFTYAKEPHYGREYQTGFRALGEIAADLSKKSSATKQRSLRGLENLGILMDLMK
jgi:hypothetical protein